MRPKPGRVLLGVRNDFFYLANPISVETLDLFFFFKPVVEIEFVEAKRRGVLETIVSIWCRLKQSDPMSNHPISSDTVLCRLKQSDID